MLFVVCELLSVKLWCFWLWRLIISLVCFDLSILRFTKVLGVMVRFCCHPKGCHRYLPHSLMTPSVCACCISIGDGFNGQEEWRAEVHSQMVHVLLFKYIHVLTTAGLAQSVERMNAEREITSLISRDGPILRVLKYSNWEMKVTPLHASG